MAKFPRPLATLFLNRPRVIGVLVTISIVGWSTLKGNLVEVLFSVLVLVFSISSIYLIWANNGSHEVYKVVWPVVGAMCVAFYLGFEKIWLEKPREQDKSIFVGIPEFNDGYIVPLLEVLNSYPSQYSQFKWLNELNVRWQRDFVLNRHPGMDKIPDQVFLDYFEIVFWDLFSERYGLGWIFEDGYGSDYMGAPSSGRWKVPYSRIYRFQLLREMKDQSEVNRFADGFKKGLQIGLPEGSHVNYKYTPRKRTLSVVGPYSQIVVEISGGASFRLDEVHYPLAKKIFKFSQRFYTGFGKDRLRGRVFAIRIYQKPFIFSRFSPAAKEELQFFEETYEFIHNNLSWNKFLQLAEPYMNSEE